MIPTKGRERSCSATARQIERGPNMAQDLTGKVAAITGAASGIGLECARALIGAGAQVVLVDRAGDKLDGLCAELGTLAIPLVVDLLDKASVARMMPGILERTGQL